MSDEETYSRRLERSLQAYVGQGKKVEVINAGVNAWSYSQMLVYFRDFGLRYQPDFVVLADANLWMQFSERNSPEFVKKFMWRMRLKNILRRSAIYHFVLEVELKKLYEPARNLFIPVDPKQDALFKAQQQSDPDAVFREAIEGVCLVARTNHVRPVLLFLPRLEDLTTAPPAGSVFEMKRAAAARFGAPLVDMTPDLRPHGKNIYLPADPLHFTAQGNAIVAERLFETFTNILTK